MAEARQVTGFYSVMGGTTSAFYPAGGTTSASSASVLTLTRQRRHFHSGFAGSPAPSAFLPVSISLTAASRDFILCLKESLVTYYLMKGKQSLKSKLPSAKVPRKRVKRTVTLKPVLPEWVIGAYDGPEDRKLSLKEGYSI